MIFAYGIIQNNITFYTCNELYIHQGIKNRVYCFKRLDGKILSFNTSNIMRVAQSLLHIKKYWLQFLI